MFSRLAASFALGAYLALSAATALAQSGGGNLRGYIKDDSGAVLPGVTVTATSTELIKPVINVTDESGLYRLNELPPGTYVLTAELTGFATTRRENILVRAGQTFTIDLQMGLSTLQETITVAGESPMIETNKPTTAITLDRELMRAAPISSRRVFSDALDLAPGVSSRNVDDGVGRRSYYFKGAVIFSHVFTLEGAPAGSFLDSSAHSIGFGGDTVQDSELKLAGVDAAAPTGTGVIMNILAPRGGNVFKGSAIYDYQNVKWNSDNTKGGAAPGGAADRAVGEAVRSVVSAVRSSGIASGSSAPSVVPISPMASAGRTSTTRTCSPTTRTSSRSTIPRRATSPS